MKKYRYHEFDSRGGEDLRFFIKESEEGNLYLDYYFRWDDGDSHCRINHGGTLTRLENYEGQWGWPVHDDEEATRKEHERMKANNIKVKEILQQKGLDGVDENGKCLFEMSTILIKAEWFIESRKLDG